LDPAYARAYAGLADCAWHLYLNPEPETSVQDILEASTKAIQLDPELAEARASYGLALHYSGQHEKAVIEFERAIELNPNLFEVYYNYSTVLRDAGNREAAAKMLARATEIAPDDFRTPFGLSHMCHDLGQLSQAKEAARIGLERAERALVEHPEVGLPAAIGAVALARLGERATAFEWASRALVIAPDDPLTRYNVACAYSLLGEPDRAIEMLEPWGTANAAMRSWVMKDTDLDSIRNHPRFEKLFNPVVARN
jgi:adenylate cyclase